MGAAGMAPCLGQSLPGAALLAFQQNFISLETYAKRLMQIFEVKMPFQYSGRASNVFYSAF